MLPSVSQVNVVVGVPVLGQRPGGLVAMSVQIKGRGHTKWPLIRKPLDVSLSQS